MLFSGSLGQLALSTEAIPNNIDNGRIAGVLEEIVKLRDLSDLVGTIVINSDAWTEATATGLHRADKDAEVAAACLVAWLHKTHAEETEELKIIFADLIFEARPMGVGAKLMCKKLDIIRGEEKKRDYIGMSAVRMTKYLTKMADQIVEEKLFATKKTNAEKLMAMLETEAIAKGWNLDTLKRYLSIGRRLEVPAVANLMDKWEFFHKRNTVVDSISSLRAIVGACDTDDELAYVMKTLFLEQQCGLQTPGTFKKLATPVNVTRAILLRSIIFKHMATKFPLFAKHIEEIGSFQFYKNYFGVTEDGGRYEDWTGAPSKLPETDAYDESDCETVGDDSAMHNDQDDLSSYKSKGPIRLFCEKLMCGRLEHPLLRLTEQCHARRMRNVLDLTVKNTITSEIQRLTKLYEDDNRVFPSAADTAPPAPPAPPASQIVAGTVAGTVLMSNTIQTQAEYMEKLQVWKDRVDKAEDDAHQQFLNARLAWVVADTMEKQISKAQGLSVVSEKKRKLFYMDYAVSQPLDWDRVKKHRQSCVKFPINAEYSYDDFFQAYAKCRTEDAEKKSDDTIVILTPSPGITQCANNSLKTLLAKCRTLIPKHCKPRVGEVERQPKTRGRLTAVVKDFVTVMFEKKKTIDKGPMLHLSGNTCFHKWPVPEMEQVATFKYADVHRLFPKDAEAVTVAEPDSDDEAPQTEDDQVLERDDQVVPFPREQHHLFGMELINTFDPDVVMIFTVASGEMVKAVILKHKYAVCFVPTAKAKDFAVGMLMEWLKRDRILPPRPEIPKPEEVLMWEKDHPEKKNGLSQSIVPKTVPADPAIVPKTVPADPAPGSQTVPAVPAIVPKTVPADPALGSQTLPAVPAIVPKTVPADPAQKAGVPTVRVPPMVAPKLASFGSSIL